MLLTCPDCRSGLEVPDGTTALVRCPACKRVFAPDEGAPPEDDEGEDEPEPPPKRRAQARDEDDRPRKRRPVRRRREEDEDEEDEDEEPPENRDFDPPPPDDDRPRKRERSEPNDGLTPEERTARRAAFARAAVGAKLVWVSFVMYMFSMFLILVFFFQSALTDPLPGLVVTAGLLGLGNWLLAAVGVGLCLSGPPSPGHWGYGISAAVAVAVHGILLASVVGQGSEFGIARSDEVVGNVRWSMLPTRLNTTMYYLTAAVYQGHGLGQGPMRLSMVTGVAEMVRTVLLMMLLSGLARAALDEEVAHQCTRAAGVASAAPALMAAVIFGFVAVMTETNAPVNRFTLTLLATVYMSVYAIVCGAILPCFAAAREVADACDEPFQSLIPQL